MSRLHSFIFPGLAMILCVLHGGCGPSGENTDTSAAQPIDEGETTGHSGEAIRPDSSSSDTLGNSNEMSKFKGNIVSIPVAAQMFDSLSAKEKSDLYVRFRKKYRQRICPGSDMKYCRVIHVLEQILANPSGLSVNIRSKIRSYLTQLWLYGANVNPDSGARVRPLFIPGELGAATQIALKNGAAIDLSEVAGVPLEANNIEQLEALLAEIRPYIFGDRNDDSDGDGSDSSSGRDGGADSGGHTDTDANRRQAPPVKQGWLYFEDVNFRPILERLKVLAGYCDNKVREVGGKKSTAAMQPPVPFIAGHLLDMPLNHSPMIQAGTDISALGSASMARTADGTDRVHVLWLNVNEAFEKAIGVRLARQFSPSRSVSKNRIEHRQLVSVAYYALRDLVGFGADGTENKPSDWLSGRLGENNRLLEELRADLTALYLAYDPEVKTTGLIPDLQTRNALLDEYLISVLEQMAAGGDPAKELGLRARLMVLNYLLEAGVVVAKAKSPGEYRISVPDYEAVKPAVVRLLGRVRSIRFFGDNGKATALIASLKNAPAGWKMGLQRKYGAAGLPKYLVYLFPILEKQAGDKEGTSAIVLTPTVRLFDRNIALAKLAGL
jgi:hypothetical protein